MKKLKFGFYLLLIMLMAYGCKKEETPHVTYDPGVFKQVVNYTANLRVINPYSVTTSVPLGNSDSFVGFIARDVLFVLSITFPQNCGVTTFILPTSEKNVSLSLSNTSCSEGKLNINKYDHNLVEGTFEFTIEKDSLMNIKGFFSIVYPLN